MGYTVDNFEELDWHDNKLHKLIFLSELHNLILDIDYLDGMKDGKYLIFPSLLKFNDVIKLAININWQDYFTEIYIDHIQKQNERRSPNGKATYWDWRIVINCSEPNGGISFASTGFELIFPESHVFSLEPKLTFGEREKYIQGLIASLAIDVTSST